MSNEINNDIHEFNLPTDKDILGGMLEDKSWTPLFSKVGDEYVMTFPLLSF